MAAALASRTKAAALLRYPQAFWRRINTRSTGGIATYRISSFLLLCSTTPPGSVAKSASSAAIRERRFSILFLTAVVSWR